ncbi:MAG: HemK2/MTQ2 family protein methyltransferase [Nanoarchaeota archaeon]
MIYEPAEDSFLLKKEVKARARGKKVLDVGTGSGIQARTAVEAGASQVLAVDVDQDVVESLKGDKFEVLESDLFENVSGKFDLIIFNPPYLPEDKREDSESALATSGGRKGDEIIVRFLETVGDYLTEEGVVLLVVSSLTPLDEIEKVLKEKGFVKKVVASEKVFMEELGVWEVRKT